MSELQFNDLPDIPQIAYVKATAPRLWARDDVKAIWVVGSLVRADAREDRTPVYRSASGQS